MRVFISYSWSSTPHEEWVLNLASRLREDGIDVVLDKWDLKEGHDVYAFMEGMVNDVSIEKVLVICDEKYRQKANGRERGVGIEAQIITSQIYSKLKQEKFIPIIAEKDGSGNPCLPTYLGNRKYIDMSSAETYEVEYERLLRNLYQKPEFQKPALGKAPEWLEQEEINHYKTSKVLRDLGVALDKNVKRIPGLYARFLQELTEALTSFKYEGKSGGQLDDEIVSLIEKMTPLRNDFVKFLEFQCENAEVDVDAVIKFLENYLAWIKSEIVAEESGKDHHYFLIKELFVYVVMVLLEYEKYSDVTNLLKNEFFINSTDGEIAHNGYEIFLTPIRALRHRNERLGLNRISIEADMLVSRPYSVRYSKDKIVQADLLLYYLSLLLRPNARRWWFPVTYYYSHHKIPLLQKLVSKKYFERVKGIFDVQSSERMVNLLMKFENKYERGHSNSFEPIPDIKYHVDLNKIATVF